MNVQIFGKSKCFDTKKAERFFSERKIVCQRVDILRYGLKPRELDQVVAAVGGIEALFDSKSRAYEQLYVAYQSRTEEELRALLLGHFELYRTPIVRWGRFATVGFAPDVWKGWLEQGAGKR